VVGGPYLRQQAEILIAISRTSFDLGVAKRLREVASELQARLPSRMRNAVLPLPRWRISSFRGGLSRSHHPVGLRADYRIALASTLL
jgi:hypothetical protein